MKTIIRAASVLAAFALILGVALIGCGPDGWLPSGKAPSTTGNQPAQRSRATSSQASPSSRPSGLAEVRVERVIDGDTIIIEGGARLRYIGIDTPETVHPRKPVQHFGKEASAANRKLVEGKVVGLEFDVERKDRYGRALAYVWLGDTLVNAWLVQQGFAKVSTYPPNVRYAEHFVRLQRNAHQARKGLWKEPR